MSRPLSIALAQGTLLSNPTAGGHWSVFLQYLHGLLDLGVDVSYLELTSAPPDPRALDAFFETMRRHGLASRVLVIQVDEKNHADDVVVAGGTDADLRAVIDAADSLWNMCADAPMSLVQRFRHRVLVDLDPGILQSSALQFPQVEALVRAHQAHITVGSNVGAAACRVPLLGLDWLHVLPFACLARWPPIRPVAHCVRGFTSVTQWNWSEDDVWLDGRTVSASKRLAYLRYLAMPLVTGHPFELAVNMSPLDGTGDRELLTNHGWVLTDPNVVAASVADFEDFVAESMAEFACCKPVYRELRTGWLSDRSVAYLASGRAVVAEDTGFSDSLPSSRGLLAFRDYDEARAAVETVAADPVGQGRAGRQLVEDVLNSREQLGRLLAAIY